MKSRSRRKRRSGYLKGLLFDPFVVGKWSIIRDNAHRANHPMAFYKGIIVSLIAALFFIVTLVSAVLFALDRSMTNLRILGISIVLFFILQLISFIIRRTCICTLCRANPLIDGKSIKHAKACKVKPLNFASTAMLSILLRNQFRCQHCGTPFILSKGFRKGH